MIGFFTGVAAITTLTLRDTVSKKLLTSVSETVSANTSFLMAIPFYLLLLPILYFSGYEEFVFNKQFLFFIFLRAFLDAFGERLKMTAFANGEMSVISSIFSLQMVAQLFISPFVTGAPLTNKIIIGAILSTLGTVTIFFNRSTKTNKKGLIAAFLMVPIFALNLSLDRMCSQEGGPVWSAFLMTTISCLFIMPFTPKKELVLVSKQYAKPLFIRGALEVLFMVLKLTSLRFLASPEASILFRLQVLFSVISGKAVFHEGRFYRKLLGAALIILGVVIVNL